MKQYWKLWCTALLIAVMGICFSCSSGISEHISDEQESTGESPLTETEKLPETEPPVYHYVHICGEVKNPGVYRMKEGSRIFQAVEQAGGFTDEAASEYLNLAELTEDGLKIEVPSREDVEMGTVPSYAVSGERNGKVNINTADAEELMALTGIGESRAEDILRYREENGKFHSVEDIMKVPGIKEGAFEKIKDNISV